MSTISVGSEALDFTLDRGADVPLGVQLSWAMRTRIGDGRFVPGARLPGLRELADAVGVNVNTVRSVYGRLEQDGLVESRQGSGTFVSEPEPGWARAITLATDAARQARRTGVDPREVAAALYVSSSLESRDAEAQRRSRLRAQIAALEQAAAELETLHPSLPGMLPHEPESAEASGDGRRPATRDARLPSAEELEQVRLSLLRRLTSLQTAIDALGQAGDAGTQAASDAKARPSKPSEATGQARSSTPTGRRSPRSTARPATAGA